jgi:hypothetical protein
MRPFASKREPAQLHPEEWPEQTGKTRVLIENPDRADLWAHADVLREAGYDVAMCGGPTAEGQHGEQGEHTLCPLLTEGHCPLVEGADVVVSTTQLTNSREILATLSSRRTPALVVEGTTADLARDSEVIGNSVEITLPVMPSQIVEAVERARSAGAAG